MLRRFVTEFLRNGGNAAGAVKRLGSKAKSAQARAVIGSRVLRAARAGGYLERQLASIDAPSKMEAAEVVERLSRQARADLGHHLAWTEAGEPYIRINPEHTDTIRELRQREGPPGEDGRPLWIERTIKVADPRPAQEALARIHGLDGTRAPEEPAISRMRAGLLALLADPEKREQLRALSLAALHAPIDDSLRCARPST
jgi:hypothetical protein